VTEPPREEPERGTELADLYMRGVNEGYEGELSGDQAEAMLDILDVFDKDGLRSYLMGVIEGEEDAEEDEMDAIAEANESPEDLEEEEKD
jgi:hypothetical protein